MEKLMYDVYVAEATMEDDYQNFNTPEKKEAYINRVFKANKVTQAQWDSSLVWYSDKIDIYLKMNDSVKARLQRDRQAIDALIVLQNQSKRFDFENQPLSYIPPVYTFSMPYMGRGFRFRMDSTEISSNVPSDEFIFSYSVVGIPSWFSLPFTSLLTLVYSDTTLYQFQEIKENKTYEFSASKYIPGDTITELRGFVRLQDSIGFVPHIQLYNIFLGDKKIEQLETDSLDMNVVNPNGTPFLDSIKIEERDSSLSLEPDSIQLLKPDSIQTVAPDQMHLERPDSIADQWNAIYSKGYCQNDKYFR